MKPLLLSALLVLTAAHAGEPRVIPLWPGEAPGSEGRKEEEKVRLTEQGERIVSGVHRPSLTLYLPVEGTATGAGVVVCPGGGHRELWTDHEGHNVGRWLAGRGIAAFIVQYRLAAEPDSTYRVDRESLADALRALRLVRSRAAEWQVDPGRLGIMGFSAGGELAGLAARRGDDGRADAADPVERQSSRSAFQALIYPGNAASITPAPNLPPAFLLCGYEDWAQISEGLAEAYLRLKRGGVPAELHIFTGAGHGFGQRPGNTGPHAAWLERFRDWLGGRGLLSVAPLQP